MENNVSKQRQSNLELLRVVSMLLIVALHYCEFGFSISDDMPVTFNRLFLKFLGFGGHMAVDIFVMISGYFMIRQTITLKKIFRLWMQTAAAVIFCSLLSRSFGGRTILNAVFAIPKGSYWFVTTYFLLMLASGFLNSMLLALDRIGHLILAGLLLTVYSVLPTCFGTRMDSSNFMLFVMLYVIAAYIRLYSPKILESRFCLAAGIGLHWACCAFSMLMLYLGQSREIFLRISNRMNVVNDLTIIICAILIFSSFRNLKFRSSRFINELGASAFGVYLLHASAFYISTVLVDVLHTPEYLNSPRLIPHALLTVGGTFAVCTLIDLVYRYLLEKPMMRFVGSPLDSWDSKIRADFQNDVAGRGR